MSENKLYNLPPLIETVPDVERLFLAFGVDRIIYCGTASNYPGTVFVIIPKQSIWFRIFKIKKLNKVISEHKPAGIAYIISQQI